MRLLDILNEIRQDSQLQHYIKTSERFFYYLIDVPYQKMKITSQFPSGYREENEFSVIYRWSDVYRKSIIAKFILLNNWFKENQGDLSFITLTGSSRGLNVEEHWRTLLADKIKLMRSLRRIIKHQFCYIWVCEPHPGDGMNRGYPHIHMIVFSSLTDHQQDRLKHLWASYGFGNYENGLVIEVEKSQQDIKDLKNYLIGYISKSWIETGGRYSKTHWDKHLFIFNAVAYEKQFRFWGSSRDLSRIMRYQKPLPCEENKKECMDVEFFDADMCQFGTKIWKPDEDLIEQMNQRFQHYLNERNKYSSLSDGGLCL